MELKEKELKKSKKVSWVWFPILVVMLGIMMPSMYERYIERQEEKQREMEKASILPNTTDMVYEIESQADKDNSSISDNDKKPTVKDCIDFIKGRFPDYYDNNEMMEKTIYYGRYIEYFYRPRNLKYYPKNEQYKYKLDNKQLEVVLLGQFVSEAVIPVYVQSDSVDSETTQKRLEKVKEIINWRELEETPKEVPDAQTNVSTQPKEMMVWIPTNGGIKYHIDASCRDMINPAYVTESEAISRGFGMCKKCFR